jgi:hypothetical protein
VRSHGQHDVLRHVAFVEHLRAAARDQAQRVGVFAVHDASA